MIVNTMENKASDKDKYASIAHRVNAFRAAAKAMEYVSDPAEKMRVYNEVIGRAVKNDENCGSVFKPDNKPQ